MPPRKKKGLGRRKGTRRNRAGTGPKMKGSVVPRMANRTLFEGYERITRMNIFPLKRKVFLRYHTDVDLGVQGATPTAYIFSANGMYDPDITSTGHQPMGYDQMVVFYQHYCVTASKITVIFQNNISDGGAQVNGAIAIQRNTTNLTVWDRIIEAGNIVWSPLTGVTPGGGPPPTRLTQAVRVADFFGVPNVLNDDTLKGAVTANPASGVFYAIYAVIPWAGGPSTNHLQCSVMIEYEAIFTEPTQPAESLTREMKELVVTHEPPVPPAGSDVFLHVGEGVIEVQSGQGKINKVEKIKFLDPPVAYDYSIEPQNGTVNSPPNTKEKALQAGARVCVLK
jgi:hypothetical protein